jgi:hypothetical protein
MSMIKTPAAELINSLPAFPGYYDVAAYEAWRQKILEQLPLPSFYTLPPAVPVYTITVRPDDMEKYQLVVTDEQGQNLNVPNPHDAESTFDYIQNELKADAVFTGDIHLIPSNSAGDSLSQSLINPYVTVPVKRSISGKVRLLRSTTTAEKQYYPRDHYLKWLYRTVKYEENPNSSGMADHWVVTHPAFWTHDVTDETKWDHNGAKHLETHVDGEQVTIHAYVADPADRSKTIHDSRLDGHGTSYDEAMQEVATKLYQHYNINGISVA